MVRLFRLLNKGIQVLFYNFMNLSYLGRANVRAFYEFLTVYTLKVSKGAKIRNRYNQVPHLAQDTNGKVTKSQLDTTNESQEVSSFPAGDHKAHLNRRVHL